MLCHPSELHPEERLFQLPWVCSFGLWPSISNTHPPRTWHSFLSSPTCIVSSVAQQISDKEHSSRSLLYSMETPKEVAISLSIHIAYTSGSLCITCEIMHIVYTLPSQKIRCALKSIWSDLLHCFQRHFVWILEDWKENLKDKFRSSKLCNAEEHRKQYQRLKSVGEIILI